MTEEPRKAAQAYKAIEAMILYGEVAPNSLVSEAQLMRQTGLGRTPVREALQQLSRNRLVEIYPSKGVLVPRVSVEEQLRILETRRVLEVLAVRLACERSTEEERQRMASMATFLSRHEPEIREYIGTLTETHDLIVAGAHNEYLTMAMAPLQGLSRRFWISRLTDGPREIRIGSKLHIMTLKAIVAQDSAAAEKASRDLNDYLVNFALDSISGK
ncbi:GntR family transcriptional regulator [Roseovarius nanhaiticus]|uniref:GntR family transcriptional regulator n=1 Tax=Roseovarius nanhaiticus TaxID=573024 RepID=UPI00249246B2|nr:GntR family transcriptional regulator [Roseovarius nanhaiticus]